MNSLRYTAETMPSPKIRTLHAYWLELAGVRVGPRKSEIDPSRIKPILPYVIVAEMSGAPLHVKYRLIGTRVVEVWGVDWTGRDMYDGPWSEREIAEDIVVYQELIDGREPIFGAEDLTWPWADPSKSRLPYYWAYFPLSEDGVAVTHALVIEDTEGINVASFRSMLPGEEGVRG